MKRGFLLQKNGRQKAGSDSLLSISSANTRTVKTDVQIVALDPSSEVSSHVKQLASSTSYLSTHPSSCIGLRIPQEPIDSFGSTECVLYSRTLKQMNYSGVQSIRPLPFEAHWPHPYEIRKTELKGYGMFATRDLRIGDLILIERPLMVVPVNVDFSGTELPVYFKDLIARGINLSSEAGIAQFQKDYLVVLSLKEAMMKVAFDRMSSENREAYLALANSHTHDGSPRLMGIVRTNSFAFENLGVKNHDGIYAAILKEGSRINHSCRRNCVFSMNVATFSFQLRATTPIKAGEEIVTSYIDAHLPTSKRKEGLKPYGFECSCLSCSSSNVVCEEIRPDLKTRVQEMTESYKNLEDPVIVRSGYNTCIQLLHDLEHEGLNGYESYRCVMGWITSMCRRLVVLDGPVSSDGKKWKEKRRNGEHCPKSLLWLTTESLPDSKSCHGGLLDCILAPS